MSLLRARPSPPHAEDWVADFRHRPRIMRRLDGERRTRFLGKHLDADPASVLDAQMRSLCLIRPDWAAAHWELDGLAGKYEARMAFGLGAHSYLGPHGIGGMPVTDLRWRAMGRTWLPQAGGVFDAGWQTLKTRMDTQELFLVIGLTRPFHGRCWPIVVGVHLVPDYCVTMDYGNL